MFPYIWREIKADPLGFGFYLFLMVAKSGCIGFLVYFLMGGNL